MHYSILVLGALSLICVSTVAVADNYNRTAPVVNFENHTDLGLDTKVAGFSGGAISASRNYPMPYHIILSSCSYAGMEENCPIELFDQKNGVLVATVYIRSKTAEVIGAPVLHGEYANKMNLSGWEAVPVKKIVIEYR